MEDDKIRDLFNEFQPELSSEPHFLSKLRRNIDSVEIVKRHVAAEKQRNCVALVVATFCGVIIGSVLTLIIPSLSSLGAEIHISLSHIGATALIVDWRIAGWVSIAAVSVFIAINAYFLTLSRLTSKSAT